MRDFKGMKRQRGRNRGGSSGGGGGGGKPGGGQNANRAFDSNGPDGVKIRGHAQHVYEKYQQLSRDAASAGDRVLVENYLQHAEHYYRLIRTLQPQRTPAEIMGRDSYTNGYDIDFEDESGEPLAGSAAPSSEGDGQAPEADMDGGDRDREFRRDREGRDRDFSRGEGQTRGDGQQREFRDRGDRPDRDREPRGERAGGERQGGERQGGDRPAGERQDRGDRPAGERQDRGERPRRDREFNRDDRRPDRGEGRVEPRGNFGERRDERRDESREQSAPAESEAPPVAASGGDEDGQMLRDRDGGFSAAPAFLQAAVPVAAAADEPERRPRRRRTRDAEPAPETGEASAPPAETEEV